jgi:hypothetical protein
MINITHPLCKLLNIVFERHGRNGTNSLQNIRPWRGGQFRNGIQEMKCIKRGRPIRMIVLWYEEMIRPDIYTSRMVRYREVIR